MKIVKIILNILLLIGTAPLCSIGVANETLYDRNLRDRKCKPCRGRPVRSTYSYLSEINESDKIAPAEEAPKNDSEPDQ